MEILAMPTPLSTRGRVMAGLVALGLSALWLLGLYAYLTLPGRVPVHFDFGGRVTSYGGKGLFLALPAAFSIAPLALLLITRFRFTLVNRYPYLLSLPAFFTWIDRIPRERRGRWVNRYFEALLGLGVLLTGFLLLIEWEAYRGAVEGRLPSWFTPASFLVPLALILAFIYYLSRLSRELKAEAGVG